ncbi:MAG TPA: ATP-binding cassette domain-containing protein [Solirubrobacteraceae bacterium]|jgi:signal transduction histidine kinase/ABC-type multidrug transport system ATPase subunit
MALELAENGRDVTAPAPLLRVEGLSANFGPIRAIEQVELEVHAGELVALAGENGAGKSTLVRCIAGDIAPSAGRIELAGEALASSPAATGRRGVAVVWQDLALCENLDIAANLMLGREPPGLLRSTTRFQVAAAERLAALGISMLDTARPVSTLSGGQRQLLAVARAMSEQPRLLILDEPTASLGVNEGARVERLTLSLRESGTTVLLVSHDIDQMFRLADRIVVMRHGRVVAEVNPAESHPDDVIALISGQQTDSSARRQLSRLHGLADRLASADPSSSLPLILSALAGALGAERLCLHLLEESQLHATAEMGLPAPLKEAWSKLPIGHDGGPVGLAAAAEETVVEPDVRVSAAWGPWRELALDARIASSWAVPVIASKGIAGVISVFRDKLGHPSRDELELVTLYAGYAASAIERERLLGELTARNRVLETIQEVLETLAGPVPLSEGLAVVLQALCAGLQAESVALAVAGEEPWLPVIRTVIDARGTQPASTPALVEAAARALAAARRDGRARVTRGRGGDAYLAATFPAPGGTSALLAHWHSLAPPEDAAALLEDAANSLRLAHERQESERARQEASALRRSQELQRGFLGRLSHELRTPLTAIHGYASSLMQTDVTWDGESEERFLRRIAVESSRLGRLVDDLLDFSAIESSTMRLSQDWCELTLVLEAAIACLPPSAAERVEVRCAPQLPVVWADHDRLEQVFVNLLENAFRHNDEGTRVSIDARTRGSEEVLVTVADDGPGGAEELVAEALSGHRTRRSATAGAGLGLTIARGIVEAHSGTITLEAAPQGTCFAIRLPVEQAGPLPPVLRDGDVDAAEAAAGAQAVASAEVVDA